MSETTTHPAGWYPNGQGKQQYWDGKQWVPGMQPEPPHDPAPQPAGGSNGLAIAALILAILLAPVGLILGIVAAVRNRRRTGKAGGLAVASIVVGATLTAVQIAAIVLGSLFIVGGANAANKAAFCSLVEANASELVYFGQLEWEQLDAATGAEAAARAQAFVPTAQLLVGYDWEWFTHGAAERLLAASESAATMDPMYWTLEMGNAARDLVGTDQVPNTCGQYAPAG